MPETRRPRRHAPGEPAGPWPRLRTLGAALCLAALACSTAGCSLYVMAGKMIFGDPKQPAAFKLATKVDLPEAGKKVLVICTAPDSLKSKQQAIEYDVVERVTADLQKQEIPVVSGNAVSKWMDQNSDVFRHPSELTAEFDADYIVHVELSRFTKHEENSPTLYRGSLSGSVYAYEVVQENGQKRVWQVFATEFTFHYPEYAPLPQHQVSSEQVFVRACVDNASLKIAQMFYDHTPGEQIH